ncbi:MAG: DUF3592 domain-containing protein [Zoogloeaceae bacterium]|nr:DUF3592 domain-containing protein [Rhodocyclaceae bacterium]MCP5235703.1 DUF3592 domain-containing protein [Zoogloeaceae bacterium]
MKIRHPGLARHAIVVARAMLLTFAMVLPCLAQTGGDAGKDVLAQSTVQPDNGLRLTLDVSPRPLVYGTVHDATIRISNGSAHARQVRITALLGEVVQFVSGAQGVRFIHPDAPEQERQLAWPLIDLPADETAEVGFRFLVSWDVTGDAYLQVDADAVGEALPLAVAHLRQTPQLPDGDRGFLGQYGALLVFFLLFVALQIALFRYTRRKRGGMLKALSLVGSLLLLFFAVTGLRNALEPWFEWQATTCEVLDVRYAVSTHESSSGSDGSRSQGNRSTTTSRFEIPLLTLRFQTPERSIVSTGFRNQSSSTGDMALLARFKAGTTTDCFYDPDDPGWVVVTRDVTVTTIVFSLMFAAVGVLFGWLGLRRPKPGTMKPQGD